MKDKTKIIFLKLKLIAQRMFSIFELDSDEDDNLYFMYVFHLKNEF